MECTSSARGQTQCVRFCIFSSAYVSCTPRKLMTSSTRRTAAARQSCLHRRQAADSPPFGRLRWKLCSALKRFATVLRCDRERMHGLHTQKIALYRSLHRHWRPATRGRRLLLYPFQPAIRWEGLFPKAGGSLLPPILPPILPLRHPCHSWIPARYLWRLPSPWRV